MIFVLVRQISNFCCFFPENICRVLAVVLGLAFSRILVKERIYLKDCIDRVFYRMHRNLKKSLDQIIDEIFIHFSLNILEILRLPVTSAKALENRFKFYGEHFLQNAIANKKGVIFVLPHIGNWELLGAAIAHRGYPLNTFYMAQKEDDLGSLLDYFRQFTKMKFFDRDRGGVGALKALKNGEILGMIADQDGGNHGVYVDFLGHWVSLPAGPANWSLKTGAVVIPLYSLRIKHSVNFIASFCPPLPEPPGLEHKERLISRTIQIARWMEKIILNHPEQYLWFYNRFKPRHEAFIANLKKHGIKLTNGNPIYGGKTS